MYLQNPCFLNFASWARELQLGSIFWIVIFFKNILYAIFLLLLGSLKQQGTVTARDCCKLLGYFKKRSGQFSSFGIETGYGLRNSISARTRFSFRPDRPWAHPHSCNMVTESFPGVKCGRGVLLTTHHLLMPQSWKSRAIPLSTLWATPDL